MQQSSKVLDARAAGGRRFEGKVAVVAGAGQGIGSATAKRFAQEGAVVVVGDMIEETANKVRDEIIDFGGKATTYIGNFTEREHCVGLIEQAIKEHGRIDALANIVGGTIWNQYFCYYTPEQIEAEVGKSFWPSMWLCWAVVPHMLKQKSGAIVNLATHAVASTHRVPYAASKGGLIALTTSLSKEVSPFGVRVNVVAPHSTGAEDRVTPRKHGYEGLDQSVPQDRESEQEAAIQQRRATEIPMGRRGEAEEQASAIVFLASEDASFISGQVLPVGGGATYPF